LTTSRKPSRRTPTRVDAEGDGIGDRPGHSDLAAHEIVFAVGELGHAAELEGRAAADDVDEAGRSVAPEQGALRPAQHFDALDLPSSLRPAPARER
jgi:hypothetical protein